MRIKTCKICGKRKKEDKFVRDARVVSGYANRCRTCKRVCDNAYYRKNEHRRKAIKQANVAARNRNAKYICNYLAKHPCVDCGENDVVVLDFDHVRGIKRKKIAALRRVSLRTIKEEIEKCEVRCANCHRRRTAKQFGWKYKTPRKHK